MVNVRNICKTLAIKTIAMVHTTFMCSKLHSFAVDDGLELEKLPKVTVLRNNKREGNNTV